MGMSMSMSLWRKFAQFAFCNELFLPSVGGMNEMQILCWSCRQFTPSTPKKETSGRFCTPVSAFILVRTFLCGGILSQQWGCVAAEIQSVPL